MHIFLCLRQFAGILKFFELCASGKYLHGLKFIKTLFPLYFRSHYKSILLRLLDKLSIPYKNPRFVSFKYCSK